MIFDGKTTFRFDVCFEHCEPIREFTVRVPKKATKAELEVIMMDHIRQYSPMGYTVNITHSGLA